MKGNLILLKDHSIPSIKREIIKIEQTPGPGDYEDLKEQPKGVTIGGRLKDRAPEDMPGPGNYTEKILYCRRSKILNLSEA